MLHQHVRSGHQAAELAGSCSNADLLHHDPGAASSARAWSGTARPAGMTGLGRAAVFPMLAQPEQVYSVLTASGGDPEVIEGMDLALPETAAATATGCRGR